MASDDVLDREEVERIAFERIDGTNERPLVNDARALLAHDAALRERVAELEGLIGEVVVSVEQSAPSEMRDHLLAEWVPRARRALDKGEDDGR